MDSLATELLKELKAQSKRWFMCFIICLVILFISNMAWLIAWTTPDSSYEVTSDNGSNAVYSEGEVNIGGEN